MKTNTFLLPIFFFSVFVFGQTVIEGVVRNEVHEPLPYTSIGIRNSSIGALTTNEGRFSLNIPEDKNSSVVVFEKEGYDGKSVSVSELVKSPNVYLSLRTATIEAVHIAGKASLRKNIGERKRPMLTFARMFDKNSPTVEQGNIYEIPHDTRINAYNFHILPSSKYSQITLKLNVYEVKDSVPVASILNESILYTTSSTGWQHIDLSAYHLRYKNNEKIALTLQLVEFIPNAQGEFVFGVTAKKALADNVLFRPHIQAPWEKSSGTFLNNIDIVYTARERSKNQKQTDHDYIYERPKTSDFDSEYKLVSFMVGRMEGEKTNYGKSPLGEFIELPDARIYLEQYGNGEPLLLLQGNDGKISDFYNQIPYFSKNFRVIAIDTRGQGKSLDFSKEHYGYEKLADDLDRVVQHLGLDSLSIVGWSDGGITGLLYSIKQPKKVKKLITIGANTNPEGVSDKLRASIALAYQNSTDTQLKKRLNLILNHPHLSRHELGTIQGPVLVVAGEDDEIKLQHTQELAKSLPNSELFIVPNATHNVPFDQPTLLNTHITRFLEK